LPVAKKILQLAKDGATIIISKDYQQGIGLKDKDDSIRILMKELIANGNKRRRIIFAPYTESSFAKLGVQRDVELLNSDSSIAWTHRKLIDGDIYFISNQKNISRYVQMAFRIIGKMPEIWNPVNGAYSKPGCENKNGRTVVYERLEANQSVLLIFRKSALKYKHGFMKGALVSGRRFRDNWRIEFDKSFGGPEIPVVFDSLRSWSQNGNLAIKYYSGMAVYNNTFDWRAKDPYKKAWIEIDSIYNIATIKVNGIDCGTLWTHPYELEITNALKNGINNIRIEVSNTWQNRLIGDQFLPVEKRVSWTTAPFRLKDKPLLPAGLIGVRLKYKTD
jgi:hypothetical protein